MNPSSEDLLAVPLFDELDADERERIASWFDIEDHAPGSPLTRQGSAGYAFFVLSSGTAAVSQDDRQIRRLGPGDFFGELSIVGDGHRTASVTATTPVTMWSMFGTRFRELEVEFPGLAERIRTAYV